MLVVKNYPANVGDTGDMGLIPWVGKICGEGHGNPLKYFCLESPLDRGPQGATVQSVAKSRTRLKRLSLHAYRNLLEFQNLGLILDLLNQNAHLNKIPY